MSIKKEKEKSFTTENEAMDGESLASLTSPQGWAHDVRKQGTDHTDEEHHHASDEAICM